MMKNSLLILCIAIMLVACNTANQAISNEKEVEPFHMKLIIHEDERLRMKILLENTSEDDLTLQFLSSQLFDMTIVHKESGEIVYQYSDERMFSQAIVTETLRANDSLTFEDEWDMFVNGKRIEAGTCEVTAQILLWQLNDEEVNPDSFTITEEITVK